MAQLFLEKKERNSKEKHYVFCILYTVHVECKCTPMFQSVNLFFSMKRANGCQMGCSQAIKMLLFVLAGGAAEKQILTKTKDKGGSTACNRSAN